jgi:acyl carrier protein
MEHGMVDSARTREVVVREIAALLEEGGEPVAVLHDDDVLLETGLDSLGFAVLITRLEDTMGFDPFTALDEPVYPRTLGELVAVYSEHTAPGG